MADTFVMSARQSAELDYAFERNGWTPDDVKWLSKGKNLASVLAVRRGESKIVPIEKPQPAPLPMSIVVNCDADPTVPSGLYLTGEGTEHRKMGKITLEKRADGKLYANSKEVVRHRSPDQMNGKSIQGHKLRNQLENVQVLNACIMDALLANPQLIPDEWKDGFTYFWGTIFRDADGRLYVEYLDWFGGRWYWYYSWLDYDWSGHGPAAALAS